MATDYEEFFREHKHGLGKPDKVLTGRLDALGKKRCRILDVGCGQGRDALYAARLGHKVVGVDLSPIGIRDMQEDAEKEGLDVKGYAADIRDFDFGGPFDIVVIDRTLHMLDEHERLAVLARVLKAAATRAELLIVDEPRNIPAFKSVLSESSRKWRITLERRGYLFAAVDG